MRFIKLWSYLLIALFTVALTVPLQASSPVPLPPPPGPPGMAAKAALPSAPSQAIIDQVINQTGGPTYTPLKAPKNIKASLKQFGSVFEGVHKLVSKKEAINYIATGGIVKEVVLPLKDSGTHILKPDMTAPGSDERPGKIVGALYQPYRGTMVLVMVFKPDLKPEKIRMYHADDQYSEYMLKKDKFHHKPGGTLDEGALVSQHLSCVTVGISQVCWEPEKDADVREHQYPQDRIADAYERANNAYDLKTRFFITDAVPDLIGNGTRANCAAVLKTATLLDSGTAPALSACDPNLYMSAADAKKDNEPIAIWVVDQQADLKGFIYEGTYLGYVPAGEYLVVNVTPDATTPGDIGVLMLVNINDYNNHYLIPSIRMQQFADRKNPKQQVAAIKDGCTWYYGW